MRIEYSLPDTGFQRPTDTELRGLARIVWAAHPWLRPVAEAEFKRAFIGVGLMWRLPQPDVGRFFYTHVAAVNEQLARLGMGEASGPAVLAAAFAHADVKIRLQDRRIGQELEIALSPLSGLPCSNRWRAILGGSPLLQPVPPSSIAAGKDAVGRELPQPAVYVRDNGKFRPLEEGESAW